MTLRLAHTVGVTASVTLATACVLFGGALPPACWVFLFLPSLWPLWHRALGPLSSRAGTALALAVVLLPLAWWLLGGRSQGTTLASVALMGVLAVRQASRILPSHDLQALVLSLLLVCVGALLNQTPSYLLLLVPFSLSMVSALITRQLCFDLSMAAFRSGDAALADAQLARTDVVTPRFLTVIVGLSLLILATAGLVFAAFPRVGLPAWGGGDIRALPAQVTLGETPWSFNDSQVAARIWGLGANTFNHGLYLRGRSYDSLGPDGFGDTQLQAPIRDLAGQGPAISYEVVQNSAEGDPLLTLGPIVRGLVTTSDNNEVKVLHLRGSERPSFVVAVAGSHRGKLTGYVQAMRPMPPPSGARQPAEEAAAAADDAKFFAHYLALPQSLHAPLAPLVAQILQEGAGSNARLAAGADAYAETDTGTGTGLGTGTNVVEAVADGTLSSAQSASLQTARPAASGMPFAARAARLRHHLAGAFEYDVREPRSARLKAPLLAFIFDHHRGNCTYFASAYAAMLREAGVPARVVGGFEGGRWDGDQAVAIFTGAHAHAWVEWYQPGLGWVVDDATPARGHEVLSGFAMWRERLGRMWQLDILQFNLSNQIALVHGLQTSLSAMGGWAFPGSPATGQAIAPARALVACLLLAIAAAIAVWAWRRSHAPKRRRARFAALLEAVLVRCLGRSLQPKESLRTAYAALAPQTLSASAAAICERALGVYEDLRFGALAPPADFQALESELRALGTGTAFASKR